MAEGVDAEFAGAVNDDEAGCAAQSVAPHGNGRGDARRVGVHANGECDAVFVQERFQGHGGHSIVVFEDGVEPQQGDVVSEILLNPLRLRNAVRDATGTEHLECFDHNDFASEIRERRVGVCVEPSG